MNMGSLARWLGPRYLARNGGILDGETWEPLDDDQLLGAILRRAAQVRTTVELRRITWESWELNIRGNYGRGPTPLSAALAAVEAMTKEDGDGR